MTRFVGLVLLLVLAAVAVWLALLPLRSLSTARRGVLVERNNRAVGLMGRYDYEAARELFAELVERDPDWHDVRVNLAIATLNRQGDGDTEAALTMLEDVLASDPANLRAQYCGGLLRLYLGSPSDALDHFELVAREDPADAYAAYYVGACHAQQQQYEQAAEWYEQARDLDPYLQSAYYGLAQTYQRLGRPDDAQAMADAFERLRGNPRARMVDFRYTRMGPKAEALAVDVDPLPPVPSVEGPLFGPPTDLVSVALRRPVATRPASVTVCDLDGDGRLDLFVPGIELAAGDADFSGPPNAVLRQTADGVFTLDATHPLAAVTDVNAALWGDIDNDGRVDAYLCRRGPNALWRRDDAGGWSDVTERAGVGGGPRDTVDGAMVDADHDGDLDVFCVNADGPDVLLSNDLDGTFRDITEQTGLGGGDRGSRQVLVGDVDADRDLDIAVIHDTPPHALYLNDRLWSYRPAANAGELLAADVAAAAIADLDADGRPSICTLGPDGTLRDWSLDGGSWSPRSVTTLDGDGWRQLEVRDLDGDLDASEWIAGNAEQWLVVDAEGAIVSSDPRSLAGWTTAVLSPGRGPALVGLAADGRAVVWPAGPGRRAFASLVFSGREDAGDGMRSNASGIGVKVAARVDSRWAVFTTVRPGSGPGQSLQPWPVGLAGRPHVEFIRLEWPDGVLQTEVHGEPAMPDQPQRDLSAGVLARIEEIQRQKSSCPVLFVWDGKRFAFVSDVLGVGGLGYLVEPGTYAEPRPWEHFLLPEGIARPRDGRYVLKLAEPMEEVCYLDAVRLVAYDVPPGWDVVVDERMGIAGPPPTGDVLCFRRELVPSRVTDARGEDVTSLVRSVDGRAAPVGPIDPRFLGRLVDEHVVTAELDEPLDPGAGTPVLVADGWVEYPYSQTMFAAWQAGATYEAPTLEARDAAGRWRTVLEQFGYPAGMPRRMALPAPGLADATAVRLRTNQEIYWDRLAVAIAEPCAELVRTRSPLAGAELRRGGFARRTTLSQRRPHYDDDDREGWWDCRYQEGLYTRFGSVEPLLAEADGGLVVFGPGDEVVVSFDVPPPPPEGWRRRLVVELDGWCKDMDLYTADGRTVAPLPDPGTAPDRRDELHRLYLDRFQSGD